MSKIIAHITDLHIEDPISQKYKIPTKERLERILRDLKKEKITSIICTGDLGTKESTSYVFEQLQFASLTLTLGNHDSFMNVSPYYSKGAHYDTQKIYSSIEDKYYKYIYLDSSKGYIDAQQISWFRKELLSLKPIILFLHHPILNAQPILDKTEGLKHRNELRNLLTNIPNKVTIFCGHYHMEHESHYKNIYQFITPAISVQIDKANCKINPTVFGYRIIELNKNNLFSTVRLLSDAN